MTETFERDASERSDRSIAVAFIVLARYLAERDETLLPFLEASLHNALAAGLQEPDLAILRLVIGAIGS